MKPNALIFLFASLLISSFVTAQNPQQNNNVIIETKSLGVLTGQLVYESPDSIKIKTEDFGDVAIAKSEIKMNNPVTILTINGNQLTGEIRYEDQYKIILRTYTGPVTISKQEIRFRGEKNDSYELKKNALSANFLGTVPLGEITYERLITRHLVLKLV